MELEKIKELLNNKDVLNIIHQKFEQSNHNYYAPLSVESLKELENIKDVKLKNDILELFKEELLHQREIERKSLDIESDYNNIVFQNLKDEKIIITRGQWFGLIIALVGFATAIYFASIGATIEAVVIGISGTVSMVLAFLGREKVNK